jgi:multidrug efflux pump subunit AcrA (membrane-fusion protein)
MKLSLALAALLSLALAACGAAGTGGGQALPTVVLGGDTAASTATQSPSQPSTFGVTASGTVVPAHEAQLGFALPGIVAKMDVAAGSVVKVGDVLAELDSTAAQLQVDQAQITLRELTSPAAVAAAEQAVLNAQQDAKDAQNKVDSYNNLRASPDQIDNAKANLAIAQDAMDEAFKVYQKYKNYPPDNPRRAQAYTEYYAARKARDNAQSNLNWLTGGPSENDVALANADLDAANAMVQEAQWYLSELKGETIPDDATGTQLAQLEQARDALKAAQDQLAKTRLLAPISGTVTDVSTATGEYVVPGQVVVAVSDVAGLQVETTDLSEMDVPQLSEGQNVSINVKALGTAIPGHLISISPVATTLGGDVVYKTTIGLDEVPEGLRAGMSVIVDYLR